LWDFCEITGWQHNKWSRASLTEAVAQSGKYGIIYPQQPMCLTAKALHINKRIVL